jgi:hypothetical protein
MANYEWFNSEFTRAGGFSWLEHEVTSSIYFLGDLYIQLTALGMTRAESLTDLMQWASCLREYLITARAYKQASISRPYLGRQLSRGLSSFLSVQSVLRALDSSEVAQVVRSSYIRALGDVEWDDWGGLMEELIEGVARGYIPNTDLHFCRDPDGVCGHW